VQQALRALKVLAEVDQRDHKAPLVLQVQMALLALQVQME